MSIPAPFHSRWFCLPLFLLLVATPLVIFVAAEVGRAEEKERQKAAEPKHGQPPKQMLPEVEVPQGSLIRFAMWVDGHELFVAFTFGLLPFLLASSLATIHAFAILEDLPKKFALMPLCALLGPMGMLLCVGIFFQPVRRLPDIKQAKQQATKAREAREAMEIALQKSCEHTWKYYSGVEFSYQQCVKCGFAFDHLDFRGNPVDRSAPVKGIY